MIILQLLTFDLFVLMNSIFQYDIMFIILRQGGTHNTLAASGQVNVNVILTLNFSSLITFIRHGSIFTFQYEYVLLPVLWQDDRGKSPMVTQQVNDSVIVPKHD